MTEKILPLDEYWKLFDEEKAKYDAMTDEEKAEYKKKNDEPESWGFGDSKEARP